ncbi:MAG: hypothetical protein M1832_002486 [Thelocarpon impressellum]|nr:MAG: hypothetical protein M1832_002486 [Thelocarpon impressellum]
MRLLVPSLLLPTLAAAHFRLLSPPARGFVAKDSVNYPCGKYDTPTENRTEWALTGGPVALRMGHEGRAVQVLLGLGTDPGLNYNITLVPTLLETGVGPFCLRDVKIPENLGLTDGQNATIQVVSSGDPTGAVYNCGDIVFRSAPAPNTAECVNGTGVGAAEWKGPSKNANGTDEQATALNQAQPSPTSASSSSSSGAAAAATTTGAAHARPAGLELGGVVLGAVGFAALL